MIVGDSGTIGDLSVWKRNGVVQTYRDTSQRSHAGGDAPRHDTPKRVLEDPNLRAARIARIASRRRLPRLVFVVRGVVRGVVRRAVNGAVSAAGMPLARR